MDVNEYMKKSLDLLERIAEGIETLTQTGVYVTNFVMPQGSEVVKVGEVVKATGGKPDQETVQSAAAEKTSGATSGTGASSSGEQDAHTQSQKSSEAPAEKLPKVTADDARKALKAYAAIEGNEAAMELLQSLGASSVSAVAEQGDDALRALIAKCGGGN